MGMTPVVGEHGVVCPLDACLMVPIYHSDLITGAKWLYWRCTHDQGHATDAVPLPARVAILPPTSTGGGDG